MQCQILLVIHKWIQGNLERESGNLSEVTWGFSPGTPATYLHEDFTFFCYIGGRTPIMNLEQANSNSQKFQLLSSMER